MFPKLYRTVAVVSIVGLLAAMLAVLPAAAADATTGTTTEAQQAAPMPGTDRDTAGAPIAGWVTLGPQTNHWYKFDYRYDIYNKDTDPANAIVELKMDTPGCIGFQITTRNRLDFPFDEDGKWVGPLANGTPEVTHNPNADNANDDGNIVNPTKLVWVGSQRASEHFYVIVINKSTDNTCRYTLSISGPNVRF